MSQETMLTLSRNQTVSKEASNSFGRLPRLPPLAFIALLPMLPTWFFLNRGFTQWFHWASIMYAVTGLECLVPFQVLVGTSVCLGWYSSMVYAAIKYGEVFLVLYQNMPEALRRGIFVGNDPDGSDIDYSSSSALAAMALAHTLDFLGHPILTYYFWKQHHKLNGSLASLVRWPVVLAAYLFSRIWSLTHSLYNNSEPGMFYIGHDIYVVAHLDCWIPAYIAETVFFLSVLLYKLFSAATSSSQAVSYSNPMVRKEIGKRVNSRPSLLYSESGVSRSSSVTSMRTSFIDE